MARHRRRRRRRGTARNRVSTSVNNVAFNIRQQLTSSTAGAVQVFDLSSYIKNEETQNRKITRVNGDLEFSAVMTAGNDLEAVFMLGVMPAHESWPTLAEWSPWVTADQAGNPAYQGGVMAPFGIRRYSFILPAGAASATMGEPRRYLTPSKRLVRPGHVLRAALYTRGSAALKCAINLQGGIRIVN